MKLKNLTAAILFAFGTTLALPTLAEKNELEVTVENDNGKITKKVIKNGKELSADEIKELEESGEINIIQLDGNLHKTMGSGKHKVMVFDSENSSGDIGKKIEMIKSKLANGKDASVWVSNSNSMSKEVKITKTDDGELTVIVDGEKLSDEAAKAYVENHDFDHSGNHKKVIVKKMKFHNSKKDSAQIGIMANVLKDGWHVNSVIEESGAADAGIQKGDVIIELAGQNLTKSDNSVEISDLKDHKAGDIVPVVLLRDGAEINLDVEARKLDHSHAMQSLDLTSDFTWIDDNDGEIELDGMDKKMIFINKSGNFKFDDDDIHMHFPDSLKDMNIFISDGQSTSKLLGKRHKFTSMSQDLAKYFGAKEGVLVLNVDKDNVFGLKDGDVIQSVNGENVSSPKSVIKLLLTAEKQDNIKMGIVRDKKNKSLKAK